MPSYTIPPPDPESPTLKKEPDVGPPVISLTEPLIIKVKPASQYRGPPDLPNTYPMTKSKRGLCLIIDNEKFENDVLPFREGSHIDANNLDILFTELGFDVTLRRNLVYNDMMVTLSNFAKRPEHLDAEMYCTFFPLYFSVLYWHFFSLFHFFSGASSFC